MTVVRVNSNLASATEAVAFAFGPFRLIPGRHVLVRENRAVKLGSRALDILHLLVIRAGQEVSKNELIEFAWPNIFVDDSNLKVHISSLRRALEDTLPQATYIATVAGRGYKFVGQVQTKYVETISVEGDEQLIASSLPAPTSLIGRQSDIEGVARALDFTRFVTLVGPGGVGKTSLAIAVAHARQEKFVDGVYFVDFSATDDSAFVPHLLAIALGVRGSTGDVILTTVEHLRNKRLLIVLDNCEHVLHAVAALAAQLVQAKTSTCLLATSREPLGIFGENVQRIKPLAFPRLRQTRDASEAAAYPAIELFLLRALETAEYRLADDDIYAVARICEALDGLPLAIEIVAAKLAHFSAAELLDSISRHFSEFRNETDGAHLRHRTLSATLDWSYQLLSAQEATIFRLLSVFTGSFEWTDVTGMARLVNFDPYQTTMALGALVSKSLLSAEIDREQLRYRLLESTRGYAAERLLEDPLAADAQRRHAEIVLTTFEKSETEWGSIDSRVWRARYEARGGDLRKALDWCFSEGGNASLGVDLATSAIRLWDEQSSFFEEFSQVRRALEHCATLALAPQRTATLAMSFAWSMTIGRQLHTETEDAWNTALNLTELSGNAGQHLYAMQGKAVLLLWTGRHEQAVSLMEEAIQMAQAGDRASLLDGEKLHASAEVHLGRLLDAHTSIKRLAEEFRHEVIPPGSTRYQLQRHVCIHSTLAFSTWLTGQPERALAMAEEVVVETGNADHSMGQAQILALAAMPLALLSGNVDLLERYSTTLRTNLDRKTIAIWEPMQRFYAAVVRNVRGDPRALDHMQSAINEMVCDRFLLHAPMYLGVLAEALLARGRSANADEAVEAALKLQRQTKENWCFPELLRVKAQIMAAHGEGCHALSILGNAREHALAIGARSFELRVVNDMAEAAIISGSSEDAIQRLRPLYENFEDKDATEDLKRSARLLSAAEANRVEYRMIERNLSK